VIMMLIDSNTIALMFKGEKIVVSSAKFPDESNLNSGICA
jgi:hypothetical protein